MALKGISTGSDFEPVTQGTHIARLIGIADLGIQRGEYKGEVSERAKGWFTFETPHETVSKDGKDIAKTIGTELTLSLGPKANLTKIAAALAPGSVLNESFDLTSLLGKCVLINVGLTSGGKPKIVSAVPLAKGQEAPASDTPLVAFDFDNQDAEILSKLPKFVRENIANAVNAKPNGNADALPEIM